MVKNPPAMQETRVRSLDWEDPLQEGLATHSSILPGRISMEIQRSLAGYSPWSGKESDVTEMTEHARTQVCLTLMFTVTGPLC